MLAFSMQSPAQSTYSHDELGYIKDKAYKYPAAPDRESIKDIPGNASVKGYVPATAGSHWFLTVRPLGFGSFIGSPVGQDDFWGRGRYTFNASAGKWLTPYLGVRAAFEGFNIKGAGGSVRNWHSTRGDILWNVTNYMRPDLGILPRWNIAAFLGIGAVSGGADGTSFALAPGIDLSYRLTDRLHLSASVSLAMTKGTFDGMGSNSAFGDKLFSANIGFTYDIGGQAWKKKKARGYAVVSRETDNHDNVIYPADEGRNNYWGLNSLRHRLGKDEDGAGKSLAKGGDGIEYPDSLSGKVVSTSYFFFRKGSTDFTTESQNVNLKAIAKTMMKYNYEVRVLAAADSHTGTVSSNRHLAIARAKRIRTLLEGYGVPKSRIRLYHRGGINLYKPFELNRQAIITLYEDIAPDCPGEPGSGGQDSGNGM